METNEKVRNWFLIEMFKNALDKDIENPEKVVFNVAQYGHTNLFNGKIVPINNYECISIGIKMNLDVPDVLSILNDCTQLELLDKDETYMHYHFSKKGKDTIEEIIQKFPK